MEFIDRIRSINESGITAQKNLTINEDYLLDHFAEYPVMPGVLMLESLVEAATWWLKVKTDFQVAEFYLRKVQNARFSNFLRPGNTLQIQVENQSFSGKAASFKGVGKDEEKIVLSAKFEIDYRNFDDLKGLEGVQSSAYSQKMRLLFDRLSTAPGKLN